MGRAERDQRPDPLGPSQSLDVIAADQSALGVPDDADLVQVKSLTEFFYFLVHQLGQFLNTAGVEGVENAPKIQAEDAKTIPAETTLKNTEDAAGGPETVKEKDGVFAALEIRQPLNLVAPEGQAKVGERRTRVFPGLFEVGFDLMNRHRKNLEDIRRGVN